MGFARFPKYHFAPPPPTGIKLSGFSHLMNFQIRSAILIDHKWKTQIWFCTTHTNTGWRVFEICTTVIHAVNINHICRFWYDEHSGQNIKERSVMLTSRLLVVELLYHTSVFHLIGHSSALLWNKNSSVS